MVYLVGAYRFSFERTRFFHRPLVMRQPFYTVYCIFESISYSEVRNSSLSNDMIMFNRIKVYNIKYPILESSNVSSLHNLAPAHVNKVPLPNFYKLLRTPTAV